MRRMRIPVWQKLKLKAKFSVKLVFCLGLGIGLGLSRGLGLSLGLSLGLDLGLGSGLGLGHCQTARSMSNWSCSSCQSRSNWLQPTFTFLYLQLNKVLETKSNKSLFDLVRHHCRLSEFDQKSKLQSDDETCRLAYI